MNISLLDFETITFIYNTFSHFIFGIMYLIIKKIYKLKKINLNLIYNIIFILGHILISFVMGLRISEKNRGTLKVSIVGSTAHSLLFISCLLSIIFNKKIDFITILFLVSQIGMIYIYLAEFYINNMKEYQFIIFLIPLFSLLYYYLRGFILTTNFLKYGYLLVFFVYLLLIIISYNNRENNEFVNLF